MSERLSRRALNRATLARQLLLERAAMPVVEAVERLAGLQAQTPHTWYAGLGVRLDGVTPQDVAELLVGRRLVRLALMRSTIHLVSARDALRLRPLVQPVLDRDLFRNYTHAKPVEGLDMDDLVAAARPLLEEKPLTSKQLGALLAEHGRAAGWGDRAPASLAYAARCRMALVQVPPRGVWGSSGPIAHTTAEKWLGEPLADDATPDELVMRYLAAFGPSTVMDAQTWSGLTRLKEVMERLRPRLVTFEDEKGRELFDLPDAPRPGPDVPAPPRLLYDFDNLLLSHADRSRVITGQFEAQNYRVRRPVPSIVLIDGFTAGEWTLDRQGDQATMTIKTYDKPAPDDAEALEAEAHRLVSFAAADAQTRRVHITQ
ncbi:winged helix DNA-binding domain-containing protein [Actinomadura sp. KC216]|uniref:winged helix DNA-binding domain-containing protein n=1 Tax=Actinomadura sp. KC216 TaxID=2530370 RepID=UPI001043B1C8|nr:winged helix DNA-binding domain-containing protein [Actinomadura sp. KC216]TDB76454.1 winged helix DNA-binding domain-containing protein [Actinomadura sp. KC216]